MQQAELEVEPRVDSSAGQQATSTSVNTADWLGLAPARLPGTARHRKPDKLLATFTSLFSFFITQQSPLYPRNGWEQEFLFIYSSRDILSRLFPFEGTVSRTCSDLVRECNIRETAAIFTPTCLSGRAISMMRNSRDRLARVWPENKNIEV